MASSADNPASEVPPPLTAGAGGPAPSGDWLVPLADVSPMTAMDFVRFPELFNGIAPAALQELGRLFERVQLKSGETLLRQGEPGDCMFLLASGRLRAYVERDGREVIVGEVGRGEVVGEMALLIDEPRSATIRAIRDSELFRLSKDAFDLFLEKHPVALKQIARVNLLRLRRSILSTRIESTVATIAVVPAGRGAPLTEFAAWLARALGDFAPTLHLNRDAYDHVIDDRATNTPTESTAAIGAWLNEQEARYRYVVYECDETFSTWTRRCLRQADYVLFVGIAGSDPAPGEIERAGRTEDRGRTAPRRELVLLHPPDTSRPSGTQAWLAHRQIDFHHHVRIGRATDFERLARFLTGRAIGLVLGAGGARGLAHIGVIRAIQELGIAIDLIGGTSCGAMVGGALAKDLDGERIFRTAREHLVSSGSLLDYTLPLVSLISGRKMTRGLQRVFGDVAIEDLWLNYFCVSTNLSRAAMIVHRTGPLWRGIRASISLPGILPPVLQEGDLLVDGGLMNKLPVDVMRKLCNGGRVIAVSVSQAERLQVEYEFPEHLSGWRVLVRRLNPFRSRREEANIASILLCSTLVKSTESQAALEREADICVRVPPVAVGMFEFKSLDAIVDAGYTAALAQLRGWSPAESSATRSCDTNAAEPGLSALSTA